MQKHLITLDFILTILEHHDVDEGNEEIYKRAIEWIEQQRRTTKSLIHKKERIAELEKSIRFIHTNMSDADVKTFAMQLWRKEHGHA